MAKRPRWTTTGNYPCPQSKGHGPLLLMETGKLYCPHRQHKGSAFYEPEKVSAA